MNKFQNLQLDTTLSIAVIVSGLVVGWFTYAMDPAVQHGERLVQDTVNVAQDGKITVTAQRPRDFVPASIQQLSAAERPAPART